MAKAGDTYRELVGTVMAALDPESVVKTEQWIEGPDGERDMDVEVRGCVGGISHFALIECKDHARPIGIGYVDAFESKLRDLRPDRAILFSNSGFTRDALKKASRVGIELASAMKAGDAAVKVCIHHVLIARRLRLTFNRLTLLPVEGQGFEFDESLEVDQLQFDGLPVVHWISDKMKLLASTRDVETDIALVLTFHHEPRWSYRGRPIMIAGLKLHFSVARDWVAQSVMADVSLGYYDHLKKRVVIPSHQSFALGMIDSLGWEQADKFWDPPELERNSLRVDVTVVQSNVPNSSGRSPKVDELIVEGRVEAR